MIRIAVLLFCFRFWADLQAQHSDTTFYYTGLTSTGTFNKADKNSSYLYNNMLKLSANKKDMTLNSTNKWLYGKQNSTLTNNDLSSSWDFNLYKTLPHFYYWGLVNYNSAYSLKINNQVQAGLGLAYNLIDTKKIFFNVSDGIIYDYSNVTLSDSSKDVYGTPRNSLRVQLKWTVKDKVAFSGNGFLQNSLQYAHDYILRTDFSLSVKVKKWLNLTSTLTYNKMTRTSTENLFVTYGVVIENYYRPKTKK